MDAAQPSPASSPAPAPGGFHFQVTCPVQRPLLNILRRFVSNVAEEMGFGAEDVMKIEMAVDEACANAFLHAYPDNLPPEAHGIVMKLTIDQDSLTVQIEDKGQGLDQKQISNMHSVQNYAAPDRDRYHGLGILIMKEFMDDVQFAHAADHGTLVTLRKFLRQPAESGKALEKSTP